MSMCKIDFSIIDNVVGLFPREGAVVRDLVITRNNIRVTLQKMQSHIIIHVIA